MPKPDSVHLAELAKPAIDEVPGGRGVLVKVLRVGVDGTDKEINAAEYGAAPDDHHFLVIGHEGFGRVEAVGDNVTEVRPGDYVVATVRRPGTSLYDVIGTNDMTTDDTYFERGINLRHGYLTEYYVDDAEFIVKIPRGLREVGVLLEPLTVVEKGIAQAYEIQRRLRVWRPRRAAVMGAGTIGILAALALRLRGLDVTILGLTRKPYLNSDLIEAIGGDVNPPVHAWAAWRVYTIDKRIRGAGDRRFLERVFQKLLLNWNWWINRKDLEGKNVFQGGFLGLDNIGVFDRSAPLPTGGHIEQSDGTAWMGAFCLNMLAMALELARDNQAYEDMASKLFEHFMLIADAMGHMGGAGERIDLWHEKDGFFYDVLHTAGGVEPMKVRSLVGLVPLFSVQVIEPEDLARLPQFERRMHWFLDNRPDLAHLVTRQVGEDGTERRLLSLVSGARLQRVLRYMLDEGEFLSPHGIRALSRHHAEHPYVMHVNGQEHRVDYEPAESSTGLFGGNSNWRGPIWFPMNFLIIESLQRFDHFFRGELEVEMPTGSGQSMALWDVAAELSRRLTRIFLVGPDGRRPVHGGFEMFQTDPHWRDLILFYEYFHGDNGAGIAASHQTGWTGLVAKLLQQSGE